MKRSAVCFASAVLMVIALVVIGRAQEVRKIDVGKLGPQIGATVPDFSLHDQNGKTQTLKSVMGPKGAMVVFFRSADW